MVRKRCAVVCLVGLISCGDDSPKSSLDATPPRDGSGQSSDGSVDAAPPKSDVFVAVSMAYGEPAVYETRFFELANNLVETESLRQTSEDVVLEVAIAEDAKSVALAHGFVGGGSEKKLTVIDLDETRQRVSGTDELVLGMENSPRCLRTTSGQSWLVCMRGVDQDFLLPISRDNTGLHAAAPLLTGDGPIDLYPYAEAGRFILLRSDLLTAQGDMRVVAQQDGTWAMGEPLPMDPLALHLAVNPHGENLYVVNPKLNPVPNMPSVGEIRMVAQDGDSLQETGDIVTSPQYGAWVRFDGAHQRLLIFSPQFIVNENMEAEVSHYQVVSFPVDALGHVDVSQITTTDLAMVFLYDVVLTPDGTLLIAGEDSQAAAEVNRSRLVALSLQNAAWTETASLLFDATIGYVDAINVAKRR